MAKNRLQLCGDFLYSQRSASRGAVSAVAAGEILCRFFKAVAAEKRCESFARTSWTAQAASTAKLFSAFCSKILEPDFYCRVAKSPKEF